MRVEDAGQEPTTKRAVPLPALTPLRFAAAMYVIAGHARLDTHISALPAAANFIRSGYTGVTLFFVLSGFILTYNYKAVVEPGRFWVARLARIYPVYLLALVLVLLLFAPHRVLWAHLAFARDAALSLLMLQAWIEPTSVAVNPPGWTLSVEAFFYAMFPWLSPLMAAMNRMRFAWLQAGWGLLVVLPALLALWHGGLAHGGLAGNELARWMEGPLPVLRLNSFLIGMFLGNVYLRSLREGRVWTNWPLPVGLAAAVILLCSAPPLVLLPLRTLLLSYSFGLVILGLAPLRGGWAATRWAQTLGAISYGVYILQFPVARVVYFAELRWLSSSALNPVLFLAVLLPASYAVYRWYEVPARSAILRFAARRRNASE